MLDKQAAMIEEQSLEIRQLREDKDRQVHVLQKITSRRMNELD